jgi:nitrite reductase/ring-hydroxylating ferredoxin subunit
MAYPLSDGILEGETITCAHHGAEFNVRTGEVLSLPAVEPIETFEVKVEGDDIYVLMEDY